LFFASSIHHYANHLARQFVFGLITKISSRSPTSNNQNEPIVAALAGYTTNSELELQQRVVDFAKPFLPKELRVGVQDAYGRERELN
jgi:AP-1 complex subunit gamma-1